jgi:drug/metabolite transporter (DMT)-like permease
VDGTQVRNAQDSSSDIGVRFAPLLIASGIGLWTACSALFAPALVKIPPLSLFAVILLITVLPCALLVLIHRRELSQLGSRSWLALIAGSWSGPVLGMLCFRYAAAGQSNMTATVLVKNLQPLIVLALAYLSLREKPNLRVWLAIVLTISGTYLVSFGVTPVSNEQGVFDVTPIAYGVLATILGALSTVGNRAVARSLSAILLTSLRCLVSAALVIPLAMFLEPNDFQFGNIVGTFGNGWLGFVMVSLIASLFGSVLYYRGLKNTAAVGAAIAESVAPLTAYVVTWVGLGATASNGQLLGVGSIFLAILIVQPRNLSLSVAV